MHLIYRAVREVSVPVTAGVLIIITVFLPLLTLQGLEGKLFTPVALTIMFALAGSLVLSLTVIPVLSSFLLKEVSHEEPWLVRKALEVYEPSLQWCLAHAKVIVLAAFVMLAFTGVVYTQIGKTFMPVMDEGDMIIGLEKLPELEKDIKFSGIRHPRMLSEPGESSITFDVATTGAKKQRLRTIDF